MVYTTDNISDMVALLIGHQTCDLQVGGSPPGWAPLRSGLGQATDTCLYRFFVFQCITDICLMWCLGQMPG